VGKTSLVRRLALNDVDTMTRWLEPIDVDDPEYWLLSNLEQRVADQLDPENEYFGPYRKFLTRYRYLTGGQPSHDSVVSQLSRIKNVFISCYQAFVAGTGQTVVIVFDTVEAVRGMYLLVTLTQWMKALPGTLFVLSGRPIPDPALPDPIEAELRDPHQPLTVTSMTLGVFAEDAASEYLSASGIAGGLSADERTVLVHLTRGHPLWLAFTVSYLQQRGLPEEAATSLDLIRAELPYGGPMTRTGAALHEAFKRRLVTPYRSTEYWQEAVNRLAVVRQSVNKEIFDRLMEDRPKPPGVADYDEIWTKMLATPWIRARENQRYITLHDAVAEELAQRVIPAHDQDGTWRRWLWERATVIYRDLTDAPSDELASQLVRLEKSLWSLGQRMLLGLDDENHPTGAEETKSIDEVRRLDGRQRELDQMKAVGLYYQLLCMPQEGCERFIELFDGARAGNKILLQERLVLEMQRFLPGAVQTHTFNDVVGLAIEDIREWLSGQPELRMDIGLRLAAHLVDYGQNQAAIDLLESLLMLDSTHLRRYRLYNQLGNVYVRAPGRARDGLKFFELARHEAEGVALADGPNLTAEAFKELGFYHRQVGNWAAADHAYELARDALVTTMDEQNLDREREEMASIQTNWAYIKGLRGSYRDASDLVESAIRVRRKLGKSLAEGLSLSVRGEIYRYERKWEKAWQAYNDAEAIFQRLRTWPELGLVYQEQAICLFQAAEDDVVLNTPDHAVDWAERRIKSALTVCRDYNPRNYPSALNRAGRIFGGRDVEAGLDFLWQGAREARALSDGWFWFANLIEYAELCYRAWASDRQEVYRDKIRALGPDVQQASEEYRFPDLVGRWKLVQGHLILTEETDGDSEDKFDAAFKEYATGFVLVAGSYIGSSGASVIPAAFATFTTLFQGLPSATQADWRRRLRLAWVRSGGASTLLLSRLEQLY
jgi:tetratricopeptide (TPR) repeat protein